MSSSIRAAVHLVAFAAASASAQLSGGIGPAARSSSANLPTRETSAGLASSFRIDAAHAYLTLDGSVDRRRGRTELGDLHITQAALSPALGGLRVVMSADYHRQARLGEPATFVSTTSVAYRRGFSGSWIGLNTARNSTPSLASGLWRQIGSRATVSVASTIRRGSLGRRPPVFWMEPVFDSSFNDTTGWDKYQVGERMRGDSGSMGGRMTWSETEARVGWLVGRVALDAVVGWRPAVDSSRQAAWGRAFATVALKPNVALSLGAGTTTSQLPYARSTGNFGIVAVRFAPAALVRPKETPEIAAVATAFSVARGVAGEYVVRVRLPRARVVELSGDFNGWTPIKLARGAGDVWEATLALKPGTYRMNLRVDGEQWVPPPGTTTVDDEFSGRVGLVIVR